MASATESRPSREPPTDVGYDAMEGDRLRHAAQDQRHRPDRPPARGLIRQKARRHSGRRHPMRRRAATLIAALLAVAVAGCTPSLHWMSPPAAGKPAVNP